MSDLLNQASLVMVPSGYKEDTVYSVVPSDGSGDLPFTRASNGTRVNSAGLVEVCPWNFLEQSNGFSSSSWVNDGTSETSGQSGYDGTNNAWLLIPNTANTYHTIKNTFSEIGVLTFSVYAKAQTYPGILLYSGQTNNGKFFNLSNGTLGDNFGTDVISSSIENVGNGWYRCSMTINKTASGTFEILVSSDGIFTYSFAGNGTGGVFIQNAQTNIGSTAKPYFPTTDRLNVPRLTYQNGGGGCPSLLLEKQSTNYIPYSEDYTNAAWVKNGISITANNTTSPDGTQNADKLTSNDPSGSVYRIYEAGAILSNSVCTVSCYFKYDNWQYAFITADNYSAVAKYVVFDLINGTNTVVSSGYTATISSVGNGWYRCTMTGEMGITSYCQFGLAPNDSSFAGASLPNGKNLYIWGTQREVSSYATSYIGPTTSSSATRVADECSKSTTLLANQTIACFFVDVVINQKPDNYAGIMEMRNNTTCDFYMLQYQASNTIEFRARGSNGVENTVTAAPALGRKKIAMYRNGDRLAVFINGVKEADQTSGTPMSAFANSAQTFYYNYDPAFSVYANCININESIIFAGNALTDAELISLTTI